MKNLLAPLALLALAPLSVLRADQVSYAQGVGGAGLATLTPITLPGFDPRLGELRRVDIEFWSVLTAEVGLENQGKARRWVRVDIDALTTLRTAGGRELLVAEQAHADADLLLAAFDGALDMTGASAWHESMGVCFQTSAALRARFDEFTAGDVSLLAGLRAGIAVKGEDVAAEAKAWADYRVRITYSYVPRRPAQPEEVAPKPSVGPKGAIKPGKPLQVEKA